MSSEAWRTKAACIGLDMWADEDRARSICATCMVLPECASWVETDLATTQVPGVLAGRSMEERQLLCYCNFKPGERNQKPHRLRTQHDATGGTRKGMTYCRAPELVAPSSWPTHTRLAEKIPESRLEKDV